MNFLGTPFKITYTARNFVSGLTGIIATVRRPDGLKVGPVPMTEIADSEFSGVYEAIFPTTVGDPQGDYVVVVKEGTYKSHSKVSLFRNEGGGGSTPESSESSKTLIGKIIGGRVSGIVKASSLIGNIIETKTIKGVLLNQTTLVGTVKSERLLGVAKCKI